MLIVLVCSKAIYMIPVVATIASSPALQTYDIATARAFVEVKAYSPAIANCGILNSHFALLFLYVRQLSASI